MEGLQDWSNKSFDLSDERSDRLRFWVKKQNAAKMFQEGDDRIMKNFFILLTASVLLGELSF